MLQKLIPSQHLKLIKRLTIGSVLTTSIYYFYNNNKQNNTINTEFLPFKLIKKQAITPTIYHYQLKPIEINNFNNNNINVNLPSHYELLDHNQQIIRAYTILPLEEEEEEKNISKKISKINLNKEEYDINYQTNLINFYIRHYPTGPMSKFLNNRNLGDTIYLRGPYKTLQFQTKYKNYLCLSGGTGLLPIFSLIKGSLLSDNKQQIKYKLFIFEKEKNEILLLEELEKLKKQFPNQLEIIRKIDHGQLNLIELKEELKNIKSNWDKEDTMILCCGNSGFLKLICGDKPNDYEQGRIDGLIKELQFKNINLFKL